MRRGGATGYVDPVSLVISRNVHRLLVEHGLTQGELAKSIGCSRSNLSRYIALAFSPDPEYTGWDVSLAVEVASALGTTFSALADIAPVNEATEFNARYTEPRTLLDKFAEHEEQSDMFITFDRLPACPRMTDEIQRRVNLSLFAPLTGTEQGVLMIERWNEWGDGRRGRYLARERDDIPATITIMLQSDFERMVQFAPPYDWCEPEQMVVCFDYLRWQCVLERGFRLLLIGDTQIEKHNDLRLELEPIIAIGVLGRHFAFRKLKDHSVLWTERADDVRRLRTTLKRLAQLSSFAPDERCVLRTLEHYQSELDKQVAARGGRRRDRAADALQRLQYPIL